MMREKDINFNGVEGNEGGELEGRQARVFWVCCEGPKRKKVCETRSCRKGRSLVGGKGAETFGGGLMPATISSPQLDAWSNSTEGERK